MAGSVLSMVTNNELDLLLLAEQTLGVFTRRTAEAMGVAPHVIDHRLRTGQWELVQPTTMRVLGTPLTFESDVLAAVLSAQDQAGAPRGRVSVASFGTCARLLGLEAYASHERKDPVEITVTGRALPSLWWDTVVHRTTQLPACDVALAGPVPCTTGARYVIDTAPTKALIDVYRAAEDVVGARLATRRVLHTRASALWRGRRNVAALRDVTAPGAQAEFRSWLERRAASIFHHGGLPAAEWNVPIYDGPTQVALADALFRFSALIVEVDGPRFHDRPGQVAKDKARDRKLAIMGYVVLRYTYWEVVKEPDAVVGEIRRALAARK